MPITAKLLFVATRLPPFIGWKPRVDGNMEPELLERLHEIQAHLLKVGAVSEHTVVLDRIHSYEDAVEPLVDELRAACAATDGKPTSAPPIAWRIVAREFPDESLTVRTWYAATLVRLLSWPSSEPLPDEALVGVMDNFYEAQCGWLWKRREELLTAAEIVEMGVVWRDEHAEPN